MASREREEQRIQIEPKGTQMGAKGVPKRDIVGLALSVSGLGLMRLVVIRVWSRRLRVTNYVALSSAFRLGIYNPLILGRRRGRKLSVKMRGTLSCKHCGRR